MVAKLPKEITNYDFLVSPYAFFFYSGSSPGQAIDVYQIF